MSISTRIPLHLNINSFAKFINNPKEKASAIQKMCQDFFESFSSSTNDCPFSSDHYFDYSPKVYITTSPHLSTFKKICVDTKTGIYFFVKRHIF